MSAPEPPLPEPADWLNGADKDSIQELPDLMALADEYVQRALAVAAGERPCNVSEYRAALYAAIQALREQLAAVRAVVSDAASAIGNGSICSPDCSVEFMREVPKEIRLHIAAKDQEIAELRRQLEAARADERQLQLNVRERIWVDATPNDDLPARILRGYVDESVVVTEPPALAEIMNEATAKRNEILRRAIAAIDKQESPG